MSTPRPLRGSCSCGRNNYIISVPKNATNSAHIFFDNSGENRRSQAALLTAWLHIPLAWFQSHTTSFFPDETHSTIRRTFIPAYEPHCKRNFCGYCGTHLTYWSEAPEDEANYLNVTIGSLFGEDLSILEDLGLVPNEADDHDVIEKLPQGSEAKETNTLNMAAPEDISKKSVRRGVEGDMTWMEEMIDGSRLGRLQKTKRGIRKSKDGTTTVEWEITEILDDRSEQEPDAGRGKRKLGDIALGKDAPMHL